MTVLGYELYEMLRRIQKTRRPVRVNFIPTQNDTVEVEVEVSDELNMSIRCEPRTTRVDDLRLLHPAYEDEHVTDETIVLDEYWTLDAVQLSDVAWDDGDSFEPPSLAMINVRDLS